MCSHFCLWKRENSQARKYRKGGNANESDEYIITNTPEVKTTFPGGALLWKKIGTHFEFVSELSLSCLLYQNHVIIGFVCKAVF